jgi:DNA primase
VHQTVDPDLIENELARRIFDDYYKYLNTHGHPPDVQYVVNNTGKDVLDIISSVLYVRTDISHNWKDIYGIEAVHGDMNYINEVDSSLAYFEVKNLKMMQAQLLNRLATETEQPRIMALVKKQMELKRTEAEIMKRMGTVILKIWKNQI